MWADAAFVLSVLSTLDELEWSPEREYLRRLMEEPPGRKDGG